MVKLKRVYDPVSRTDGTRFLVERLWPRGLSKAKAAPERVAEGGRTQHRTEAVVQSRSAEVVRSSAGGIFVSSTHSRSPGGLS